MNDSRPRYTAAGDRSTLERDYAEGRFFRRLGAAVIVILLVGFLIFRASLGH